MFYVNNASWLARRLTKALRSEGFVTVYGHLFKTVRVEFTDIGSATAAAASRAPEVLAA